MLEDLATRVATIYARRKLDLRMLVAYVRDGHTVDLVRSRAPMHFDADSPATIGIELTNACQLRCLHCDAQHESIRGRAGYMSDEVFARLVDQLRELKIRNLRVIGGGEPTLHARFPELARKLRGIAPFTSVTTNGQRMPEPVRYAMLEAFDVVEISVASDHAEGYEHARKGGDFALLLRNIEALQQLRGRLGARTLIQIRVMIRPSDRPSLPRLLRFWSEHGDVVSTQRLQDYFGHAGDVFPTPRREGYPPCVLPFRMLGVGWNGDVPLCRGSAFQTGTPEGLLLGNITKTTLAEMWRGPIIRQYRDAHRKRDGAAMPVCRGCNDAQAPAWRRSYDNNEHLATPALVPVQRLLHASQSGNSSAR
jgi:MoaA/NifB/PqqE/SkfB family radical SAM enzyme